MTQIKKTIQIEAPLEKVYALARDPRHWSDWWVGLSEAKAVRGDGSKGTEVEHTYTLVGIPFALTTRVIEEGRTGDEARWVGAIEGQIKGKQEWHYIGHGDSTEVSASIDYALPGKALGKIADRLVIERMEERALASTLENLRTLCKASST